MHQIVKYILPLTLVCGLSAFAATLPMYPVIAPDGVSIDPSAPGIGRSIFANPGSTWDIYFNDDWQNGRPGHHGDFDFNDAMGRITFGTSTFGFVSVNLVYVASSSGDINDLKIGGLLSGFNAWLDPGQSESSVALAGSLVTIRMLDETTNHVYYSGAPGLNPDGVAHAFVAAVPEPATMSLAGGILVGVAFVMKRNRRRG